MVDHTKLIPLEAVQKAKTLFKATCTFVRGVSAFEQLPQTPFPEIAFWGRSNVGKSSLINRVVKTQIARTSNTPGRTQQINFFNLQDRLYVVDLPGYGYAKAPLDVIEAWNHLMEAYLQDRPQLKRVFLLIDSRHGLKPNDLDTMRWLDRLGLVYQIVLTKSDKVKKTALEKVIEETTFIIPQHPAAFGRLLVTSSEKDLGIQELRFEIAAAL